jgi:hypothetical protein
MKTWNPFMAGNPSSIGQQSLVGQVIGTGATGRGSAIAPRKRRSSRKTAARRAAPMGGMRRPPARGKKPARLVKGSAAAKAYMAKIRRKRR